MKQESISKAETGISRFEFDYRRRVVFTDLRGSFAEVYPYINRTMMTTLPLQDSRAGKVRELLDVKTIINNPYRRCVGGYARNINVFFLLAEAMWIVTGRKDVEFLKIFNGKMVDFPIMALRSTPLTAGVCVIGVFRPRASRWTRAWTR